MNIYINDRLLVSHKASTESCLNGPNFITQKMHHKTIINWWVFIMYQFSDPLISWIVGSGASFISLAVFFLTFYNKPLNFSCEFTGSNVIAFLENPSFLMIEQKTECQKIICYI